MPAWYSIQRGRRCEEPNFCYAPQCACESAGPIEPQPFSGWHPIGTADWRSGESLLLACAGTTVPMYCGRWRRGTLGEPNQDVLAWRCDSSGRYADPTHWMPLPKGPG